MALPEDAQAKMHAMMELAEKAYRDTTVLSDAVTFEKFDPKIHTGEFYQLPYRTTLKREWFTDPTVVLDLVFGEIGRGIAFSEARILVEELDKIAQPEKLKNPLIGVLTKISDLHKNGYEPTLLFAPLDYYMDAYMKWLGPQLRIVTEGGHQFLKLGREASLRIVWSSKLIPFNDFYIVNKKWAKWIIKKRFDIEVRPNADFDTIFRTVYRLEPLEGADAVRRISGKSSS